jgi:hypothetical protein
MFASGMTTHYHSSEPPEGHFPRARATMAGFQAVPIVSSDGQRSIELTEYEGRHQVPNHDTYGYYFLARTKPHGGTGRVRVTFSGISELVLKPSLYGLATAGQKEADLVMFSQAALGEYLDTTEPAIPSDGTVLTIECDADMHGAWETREPADPDAVEDYVRGRLYAGWMFGRDAVLFTNPDFLRLRITSDQFVRSIQLGTSSLWELMARNPFGITLRALPELLTEEKSKRKRVDGAKPPKRHPFLTQAFVAESRLSELRAITGGRFDMQRLIALAEELNNCWGRGDVHAVAMLTRAIIDHVPPVFNAKNFDEVANNYAGSKSFKDSMQHLANSAKKIADGHLHTQIRRKEVLPTSTQVDFSRDLDVLLAEIVRIC